ncbi:acetyl-CoA carboxylase biotin carboxyl carrier protein subunit [Labilibaculum sp. A4]|uniref:Acetyl-CoA carboxylase biotin carboxyl carrier protein subunit n=1 Tax=Labilibaculum manganireducens TaxID=1940525 RepID=A0A2N3I2R4_9BACT|nr:MULTISPECIES: biotin/lipoyl-containing protein [Labilibaculum]MDQ1769398.1 biotin/lipoyl-containing protein [Labilibaculum euxinus]MWN74924.1 acetyl-CoA carboxylase biotin carboxyl carrier protein subunit [Labilibaculum euxinus]PKQ64592.1 acetyl-CoA carboxylase biotin carboxyl carrier protein subunit [Labilibaculum manganireducens]
MKKFKFTIRGQEYDVEIKDFEGSNAKIEVNGTSYDVDVHVADKSSKTPRLVRKPVVNKPGEGSIKKSGGGASTVKAPLPGSIIKINIAVGDSINPGDTLLVMEAMKMENNVLAEKGGTVKAIKVAVGDSVLQDDVLIEIA